jgi:peptidoglycan-associated lipoprotein
MMSSVLQRSSRLSALKIAAVLALALGAAACSSGQTTQSLAAGGTTAAPGSAQDFALNVGDRVFFDSDSTELTPTAVATLDRQAQWLTRYPRHTFLIEGHADERGTREYNFSLGASRSQVVRDYLASRGISPARMRTVSYGKERPVAVCNDISCWSQNRRAVTLIDGAAGM